MINRFNKLLPLICGLIINSLSCSPALGNNHSNSVEEKFKNYISQLVINDKIESTVLLEVDALLSKIEASDFNGKNDLIKYFNNIFNREITTKLITKNSTLDLENIKKNIKSNFLMHNIDKIIFLRENYDIGNTSKITLIEFNKYLMSLSDEFKSYPLSDDSSNKLSNFINAHRYLLQDFVAQPDKNNNFPEILKIEIHSLLKKYGFYF